MVAFITPKGGTYKQVDKVECVNLYKSTQTSDEDWNRAVKYY